MKTIYKGKKTELELNKWTRDTGWCIGLSISKARVNTWELYGLQIGPYELILHINRPELYGEE